MLSPYRVIDLACDRGISCGQILADLGADVIQVEPRSGSAVRREGPFYRDEPGPERSLTFWAYARGKRSIALDLDDPRDREVLQRLIAGADFLIEAETPGRFDALGFGDAALDALQPGLCTSRSRRWARRTEVGLGSYRSHVDRRVGARPSER